MIHALVDLVKNTKSVVVGNMDKKEAPKERSHDVLINDILLRLAALERLLIAKGVFTVEEGKNEINTLVSEVMDIVKKTS